MGRNMYDSRKFFYRSQSREIAASSHHREGKIGNGDPIYSRISDQDRDL